MIPWLLLAVLGLSVLQVQSQPFVEVVAVAPDYPAVYDVVDVTFRVYSPEVPVVMLAWAFRMSNMTVVSSGVVGLNMTGECDYMTHQVFTYPGDYYVQVSVQDAVNRTAADVYGFYVEREGTDLVLSVSPKDLNTTRSEYFTMIAILTTSMNEPVLGADVVFEYTCSGDSCPAGSSQEDPSWYAVQTARTNQNGQAVVFFKPPFEGQYQFRVRFEGDELHLGCMKFEFESFVTPEFPELLAGLLLPLLLLVTVTVSRRRCIQ